MAGPRTSAYSQGDRSSPDAAMTSRPADDLDNILDTDVDMNNAPRDADEDTARSSPRYNQRSRTVEYGRMGLGIDDEIKIRKPRAPIAKLDEDRLLSPLGIPKLRRIARTRLKFRGKGHEFSDVARLLNTYQLWLDELFPKAKFVDGLAIIEKVGRKKRLQIMRREWIEEGKPQVDVVDQEEEEDRDFVVGEGRGSSGVGDVERMTGMNGRDAVEDDLYAEDEPRSGVQLMDRFPEVQEATVETAEADMDEFDAILAEEASRHVDVPQTTSRLSRDDDFADDEEAMAGMW